MVVCNYCYVFCLDEEYVGMMKECICLDCECVDICEFVVYVMLINSKYVKVICFVCVEVCEVCGNECKKYDFEYC